MFKRITLIALLCLFSSLSVTADEFSDTKVLAEKGVAYAQFNLGLMYAKGMGVPKDPTEAVKWYLKAAKQGDSDAQQNLAYLYSRGREIPKNTAEAYVWYSILAASDEKRWGHSRDVAANLLKTFESVEALNAAQKRATKIFEEIQ